ncbi:MAG: type II toxin-antitoxin system VapC family toxin [Gammaproteobacteria bacterium]
MMKILLDSNVILDLFTEDPVWFNWSAQTVAQYAENHILIINPIIYAEISIRFSSIEELEDLLLDTYFEKINLPWEACFLAGKCFLQYKKSNGKKTNTLPDFFIGAHAAVSKFPLITRDINRYKTYFPSVELIHP